MTEKLQKVLAGAGYGSRRELEGWIRQGRIRINGEIAMIGVRVADTDKITIDGRLAPTHIQKILHQTLIYNKPLGLICTRSDPSSRNTVFDQLPKLKTGRWIAVGRLDINTSGLMLFTTDGELAHRLMHPSFNLEREYLVRVLGHINERQLQTLQKGVIIDNKPAKFNQIIEVDGSQGANRLYRVVLTEGRNREVRKLWESQGITVSRLSRIRFGSILLPKNLSRGKSEPLSDKLLKLLRHSVNLNEDTLSTPPTQARRRS